MNEDKVNEVVEEVYAAGDVYAAINNAADALKDVANPDNVKSIHVSIHRVPLKDIPEGWEFEKIGEGDRVSMIATTKVGPISVTAHLAK